MIRRTPRKPRKPRKPARRVDVHVPEKDGPKPMRPDVSTPETNSPAHQAFLNHPNAKKKAAAFAKAQERIAKNEAILKRQVSEKQRAALADKKKALPDGSFPIASVSDLKNAIKANGRAKDPEKAKKFIISRAKKMGQEDLIPSEWLQKSAPLDGQGNICKVDDEQRIVYGWASIIEHGNKTLLDRQGDFIDDEAELEKAAMGYMLDCRIGKNNHDPEGSQVSRAFESVVFTTEKIEKMGLPSDFPRGWWVGFKVDDDEVWDGIKKGEFVGFSIHGVGQREEVEIDMDDFTTIGKSDMTYDQLRDMTNDAFRSRYCGLNESCYVRDMTDTWVVFSMYNNTGMTRYYQCDYSIDGDTVTLGEPKQVMPVQTYRPVTVMKGEPCATDVHMDTGMTSKKKKQRVIPVSKAVARNRAARERVKNG